MLNAAGLGNEGSDLDELASMAVSRSLELSKDSSKAAKSRKRKALSDFLKAVSEAGVSKRRSAIPRGTGVLSEDMVTLCPHSKPVSMCFLWF